MSSKICVSSFAMLFPIPFLDSIRLWFSQRYCWCRWGKIRPGYADGGRTVHDVMNLVHGTGEANGSGGTGSDDGAWCGDVCWQGEQGFPEPVVDGAALLPTVSAARRASTCWLRLSADRR